MTIVAFLFAFLYAFIITMLIITLIGRKRSWTQYWPFFVVILLVAIAAGLWTIPAGPVAWGFYWVPGLLAALIFALLLIATVPSAWKNKTGKGKEGEDVQKGLTATSYYSPHAAEPQKGKYPSDSDKEETTSLIYWLVIFSLVLIIIAGIIRN